MEAVEKQFKGEKGDVMEALLDDEEDFIDRIFLGSCVWSS